MYGLTPCSPNSVENKTGSLKLGISFSPGQQVNGWAHFALLPCSAPISFLGFGDSHLDKLVLDGHASFEDVRNFDVFVYFWPVQHSSIRVDLEMGSLLTARVRQSREAAKGNGDASTIAQANDKLLIPNHHTCREGSAFI